jgi:hypothetical protein
MSGALLQIMAIGAEDVSIMGTDDTRSFFKKKYKRHAPFAIQTLELDVPRLDQVFGESFKITIPRKGDMLSTMWIQVTMKKLGMPYFPAEEFLQSVQLFVGQQMITTCTGDWLRVRNELFHKHDEKAAYRRLTDFSDGELDGAIKTFWIPITFFLDVTPLPLISLQMHNVDVSFSFAPSVAGIDPAYKPEVKLWADYIFLSNEERAYFAKNKHIILIEQIRVEEDQVQLKTTATTTLKTRLYFRHPVKYIVWTTSPRRDFAKFSTSIRGDTTEAANPMLNATITFDTHDRIAPMSASYFNLVQPYTYLKTSPCAGIHFYSFSHDPQDRFNPTGSANFSRISTVVLTQTYKKANANITTVDQLTSPGEMVASGTSFDRCRIHAANMNFLRIQNGLGALAYAL